MTHTSHGPLFEINPDMATDDSSVRQKILDRTLERRKSSAWDHHCAWAVAHNKKVERQAEMTFWICLGLFICVAVVMVAAIAKVL